MQFATKERIASMDPLFSNKVWNFKNFNMVTELDIAGEFIYDAIHTFNQMNVITQESMLFSFLYHASVGIERLQKILLVLWKDIDNKNYQEFEKSLITHSHGELSKRITESTGKELNSRENEFLHLLGEFYKTARYQRFNIEVPHSKGQQMLADFIEKHVDKAKIQYAPVTSKILLTANVKELIGRVIGVIAKQYYILLRNGCTKNNTYTYELRNGSKAEKIFLLNHRKNSLQHQKVNEKVAFKELLIYLMNTKDTNSFLRFAKEIQPLDFDIALVNEYLSELSQGTVPQSLIEEVEYQYEENSCSLERREMVDLIGNTDAYFDNFETE